MTPTPPLSRAVRLLAAAVPSPAVLGPGAGSPSALQHPSPEWLQRVTHMSVALDISFSLHSFLVWKRRH